MAKASKSKKSPALSPGVKKDSTGSGKKYSRHREWLIRFICRWNKRYLLGRKTSYQSNPENDKILFF